MDIVRIDIEELELALVEPFETSFGVELRRRFLLVHLEDAQGTEGWGECVASREPLYSEETVASAWSFLAECVVPRWRKTPPSDLEGVTRLLAAFRGNRMAKSALQQALVDQSARRARQPLARWLGGRRSHIPVGVSVGIHPTASRLVARVGRYVDDGYRRIKLKVRPGYDAEPVCAVRRAFPDLTLWVDANQAYAPTAGPRIAAWARQFRVAQVEQPFPERALRAHARLARRAPFRVCLDESIVDSESLDDALDVRAMTSVNVKTGRIGGPLVARELARRAVRHGVVAWVGGMLESGVGRAHNVHFASLGAFTLPGDISASDRYYLDEIIDRPFALERDGTLAVPSGPGTGVELAEPAHRRAVRRRRSYRLK
ncbi:MAG: o-succinylbenzoate synthase [Thermoplasmata archaeon]